MKSLDLFSGIGGMALGLEESGISPAAFCEIEPYCRQVLAKHWPEVPIHEDIRELDGRQYSGAVDVVCGGFPCQPFSQAGKRGGAGDDRHLWPEMFRVIREVQPAWILGENVPGIITMELDSCLADLEGEGYRCQTFDLPACGVDAPHIRHRIWILAYADRNRRRRSELGLKEHRELESERGDQPDRLREGRRGQGQDVADARSSRGHRRRVNGSGGEGGEPDRATVGSPDPTDAARRGEALANPSGTGLQRGGGECETSRHAGHGSRARSDEVEAVPDAGRRSSEGPRSGLGGQSEPARWLPEPGVGRVAHGVPNRVDRIRGLGNAVVPQIVAALGELIVEESKK